MSKNAIRDHIGSESKANDVEDSLQTPPIVADKVLCDEEKDADIQV